MAVHAGTVIAVQRLRHKGRGLSVRNRRVLHNIFEEHDIVCGVQKIRKAKIYLALAGSRDFVVMALYVDPHFRKRK